jgi:5-formyltetrahydrofolate cyclo-ligase
MADHPEGQFIPSAEEELLRRRVKAELRKRMRGLRASAPASACAERSTKIVAALEALEPLCAATAVALFWPIVEKHEVDLRALDARLRERGVKTAYPSIDPETRVMTFRFPAKPDAMEERGLGFADPGEGAPEAQPGEIGAIVVPALAIDPSGHRIGYGAGYYDRALPRFAPPAFTVGVAFDYQLLAEVPVTETDVALDWIVTDARALRAEPRSTSR